MRPPWIPGVMLVTALTLGALVAEGQGSLAVASPPQALCAPISFRLSILTAAAASDDKQRVAKKQPRYKPDSTGRASAQSSGDNDEGSTTNCFFDCLGSLFSGLLSSPTPPPPPVPVNALGAELTGWTIGDQGRLQAPSSADSVWLWDGPGGADQERAQVGRLPSGVPMIVVETHAMGAGLWLRVRPVSQGELIGWIPASSLGGEPLPESPEGPVTPMPRHPPTWGVMLALGGGGVGPADLNLEYSDGGLRIEAQYLRYLPKHWQSGAGVGWRDFSGHPRVDYVYANSTLVDEPSNSRLQILDIGIRAGMRHGRGSPFRFWWMLGPALYHVHERADISVINPGTGFQIDHHREQLSRWAGGGDLRIAFGWRLEQGVEVGLLADGYLMAWEGQHKLSLTTDFLDHEIHGFDVALTVTFPAP